MATDSGPDRLQEVHLRVANSTPRDLVLVLEPWGEEHAFPRGDVVEVVANGPAPGSLDLDLSEHAVTVCAWPGSTAFLFRDGKEFGQGQGERTRVPMNAYPASVSELSSIPPPGMKDMKVFLDTNVMLELLDSRGVASRLLQAFETAAGRPDNPPDYQDALELFLGKALVEGLKSLEAAKTTEQR